MTEFETRGNLLGMDIQLPRVVAMLGISPRGNWTTGGVEDLQEMQSTLLLKLIQEKIGDNPQNFCMALNRTILILFCTISPEAAYRRTSEIRSALESFYPVRVNGGISSVSRSCMDLPQCYLEVKTAKWVAMQSGSQRIFRYNEVSLEFITESIAPNVKRDLVRMVFSSCSQSEKEEILQTLHLYFKNDGNIKRRPSRRLFTRISFSTT